MGTKISCNYSENEVYSVFSMNEKHWAKLKKAIDKEFQKYHEVRVYINENKNVEFEGHCIRDMEEPDQLTKALRAISKSIKKEDIELPNNYMIDSK
jgi:hypothetical protein